MNVERLAQQAFGLGRTLAVTGQVLLILGLVGALAYLAVSIAAALAVGVGAVVQGLLLLTIGRYVQMRAAIVAVQVAADDDLEGV